MSNLAKLSLYIFVNQKRFIDGNNLKNDIINHLPQLKKFIYNIRSRIYVRNQIHLLSNEDIQRTLTGLGDDQVISYVDYFPKNKGGQCHLYTYPYKLRYYHNITNSFLSGLFKYVREAPLFNERPFELEFFIRIARAFSLLEKLSVTNPTLQNQKSNNNNEHLSIIEYLHLNELDFAHADDNYVEQFLLNTNTYLPNNICLWAYYNSLRRVTHNFTRDATRVNCAKVNILRICGNFQISKRLSKYFSYAKISEYLQLF
jgi:hypothetical protein